MAALNHVGFRVRQFKIGRSVYVLLRRDKENSVFDIKNTVF